MKKLYRSNTNKVFAGILGGLGDYFDVDPVLFRLLWVLVTIFTGLAPGIIVYIIAIFIIPKEFEEKYNHKHQEHHRRRKEHEN